MEILTVWILFLLCIILVLLVFLLVGTVFDIMKSLFKKNK